MKNTSIIKFVHKPTYTFYIIHASSFIIGELRKMRVINMGK